MFPGGDSLGGAAGRGLLPPGGRPLVRLGSGTSGACWAKPPVCPAGREAGSNRPPGCGARPGNRPPDCGALSKVVQLGKCVRATTRQPAGHYQSNHPPVLPAGRRGATTRQAAGHYQKWLNWANASGKPPVSLRGTIKATARQTAGRFRQDLPAYRFQR